MATATRTLGPADHGQIVSMDEFETAPWEEGYRYELIKGRLYVSPVPEAPHDGILEWQLTHLGAYSRSHPEVINYISTAARIYIPGQSRRTTVQPDIAAY